MMDLTNLTRDELERLLEILPEEIRRREAQDNDAEEAERRNPDGHLKLLHLWPVKLLQAGRVNYA